MAYAAIIWIYFVLPLQGRFGEHWWASAAARAAP